MAASARTLFESQQAQPGLRERKKHKTRIAIRRATYRLIAEQGYEATTVEQIAEAAEVSPSTVFRYFPTKEDIVLTDEYDLVMAEALRSRPADEAPIASLRAMMTDALTTLLDTDAEEMRQRARLLVEVPSIRARMAENMSVTAKMLTGILAERGGREADDLELRVFTATVASALREATIYWGEHGNRDELIPLIHRALDVLEHGLRP